MDTHSSPDLSQFSFITPHGYSSGSCGYCKDPVSSGSYYAESTSLTAEHYQILMDRNWRRSGTTLYKPDQIRSCCPHYTIRLPAAQFHASRDQRQTLHRWNRFVLGEEYIKEAAKRYPQTKDQKKQKQQFDLSSTVQEAEYSHLRTSLEPAHRFEVNLEPAGFLEEKYILFEQYQRLVHKDSSSRQGFKRFLCESPIPNTTRTVNGASQRLGSYHQCYRLDGKLIAMGVLDLVPHGVSAVYLLYDVEYEKYSFGKISALHEASLAIEDGYQFYYMGYYIHSCTKMAYKNNFKPQYILDPDTFQWDPLDADFLSKLDTNKFVSLSRETGAASTGYNISSSSSSEVDTLQDESVQRQSDNRALALKTPTQATRSGLPVFALQVPGVMNAEDLQALDLGSMLAKVHDSADSHAIVPLKVLQAWYSASKKLEKAVGELVACVGPEVYKKMVLDFT